MYRAEHRGTKELDFLLGRFARANIQALNDAELELFDALLLLPEPQIERMIMKPEEEDAGVYINIISQLRLFHGLSELENSALSK